LLVNRWVKLGLWLVGLAGAVGIGLLLDTLRERDSRLPRLALTLPEERKRARQAGLPRTLAQVRPPRFPFGGPNAAPLLREAVEHLPAWTPEERAVVRRYLDLNTESLERDRPTLEALLDRSADSVGLVRQSLGMPLCDFGWDSLSTDDDWKQRREVLLGLDRFALTLQVFALGSRSKPELALSVLGVVERLTRRLTQEGGMLVWQSRAAHTQYAARLLALLAREHPELTPEVERQLRVWSVPSEALDQAWRLQCVKEQGDATRARVRTYKPENEPFLDYNPLWRELDRLDHRLGWQLYADATETINLRYWRRVQECLRAERGRGLAARWRALKALDQEEDARGTAIPGYWYPQRYSGHAAQLVLADLALQFVQLELTMRRTGTHPEALDPFSGKPLLWKESVVYSVGPDGHDDGGTVGKDMVWNWEKKTAPLGLRSRKGTMRRPGRQAGSAE